MILVFAWFVRFAGVDREIREIRSEVTGEFGTTGHQGHEVVGVDVGFTFGDGRLEPELQEMSHRRIPVRRASRTIARRSWAGSAVASRSIC